MAFNPRTKYDILPRPISLKDFHEYATDFVVRPPYQRKSVWSRKKQQELLDSLFRRYYVPRIVLREVRLSETKTKSEVIDGQQRIRTAQLFFANQRALPSSLHDVHPGLPGATYDDLPNDLRRFVNDKLVYDADVVKGIDDPRDPEHQRIATEIFWRLQQGESLNYMEIAHARLSSTARNFVVRYADDQTFDYAAYAPVDTNPEKHPFFSIIRRNNDRMQHLALLTRLLILEEAGGPAEIKQTDVQAYIDRYQSSDGVASDAFAETDVARRALSTLGAFYDAFADDPLRAEGDEIPILKVEYFIVSLYLLLRHLRAHYVYGEDERQLFQDFAYDVHSRWRSGDEEDIAMQTFQNKRQQAASDVAARHLILRQLFFEYAAHQGHAMRATDTKRRFSEAERIRIYRRDEGLCQQCLAEGRPPREAQVPWSAYEADHVIPHARGGRTVIDNGQVLCSYHNGQKGARAPEAAAEAVAEPGGAYRPEASTTTFDPFGQGARGRRWITPIGERGDLSPADVVERTVGNGRFGFSSDAIQRNRLRPGDRIAFYASQRGVVADARVASRPYHSGDPGAALGIPDAAGFPYLVDLDDVNLYDEPRAITEAVRAQLHAFADKDPSDPWGWFVISAHEVTPGDFDVLTR